MKPSAVVPPRQDNEDVNGDVFFAGYWTPLIKTTAIKV